MIQQDDDRMVFLDLETTGLDTSSCDILEIAAVMTDLTGTIEFGSVERVIKTDQSVIDAMIPEVHSLHSNSGLVEELRSDSVVQLSDAVGEINSLIDSNRVLGASVYLNGSGVAEYDRPILARLAPSLEGRFHYRADDVSMVRNMLMKLGHDIGWTKGIFAPPEHRAMSDVRQSIAQWKWFSDHVAVTGV